MSPVNDGDRLALAERPESARTAGKRRWRASRLWVAIVVVAALAATYYALAQGTGDDRALSPRNPSPNGAQAVARVLGDHGVSIGQPENLSAALDALAGSRGRATLLLHDPDGYLNPAQLRRLATAAPHAVLVTPGMDELRAFAPGVRPAGVVPGDAASPVSADCGQDIARQAGTAGAGGKMYRAPGGCFAYPTSSGPAYGYAVDGGTIVIGNPAYLDNGNVLEYGHASLALRALGVDPTLVWYQPTIADHVSTAPAASPFELLPAWVSPALAWLMVVGVIAICWRTRRDGPLVPEPLPVVVPSSETAEGRARLYRDARAIDAAAAALRSASLGRLAAHLRLGHGTTADGVVATAAREFGLPGARLRRVYFPGRLASEAALVAWANELHTLEKEIGIP